MKRIVVFSLCFLLLVAVSISGSINSAFAKASTPTPPEVVNLVCQVGSNSFTVYAVSPPTTGITLGDQCGTDLTTLAGDGFKIRKVSSSGGYIVYTLVMKGTGLK